MMSLKTIPGFGKSGTSRILAARSRLSVRDTMPERPPEELLRELLRQLAEPVQILESALARLRVP